MEKYTGMSYARSLLEKYGWKEGKGLGKTETGIVEAVKPKLKFDNSGVGHDHSEQFTFNWWEHAFNEAASRISINTEHARPGRSADTSDLIISTKRPSIAKLLKENTLQYGSFIKTETLKNGGEVVPVEKKLDLPEEENASQIGLTSALSDDELLRICGGRTAHKAARHGNKLVGKLARVIEQEKEHVSSLKKSDEKPENYEKIEELEKFQQKNIMHVGKKKRKKKYVVEKEECDAETIRSGEDLSHHGDGKKKKWCSLQDGDSSVNSVNHKSDAVCSKKKRKKISSEVTFIEVDTGMSLKSHKSTNVKVIKHLNENSVKHVCSGVETVSKSKSHKSTNVKVIKHLNENSVKHVCSGVETVFFEKEKKVKKNIK